MDYVKHITVLFFLILIMFLGACGGGSTSEDRAGDSAPDITPNSPEAIPVAPTEKVFAVNGAGSSDASNLATATTPATPEPLPGVPEGVNAAPLSDSVINLTWTGNTTNTTVHYVVERALARDLSFVEIGEIPSTSNGYKDTSLEPDTRYRYRVKARSNAGDSDYSAESFANTLQATPEISISWISGQDFKLTWTYNRG